MAGPVSPVSTSDAVADYIREQIHNGDFEPGDRLPPQRELAQSLAVSRVSVGQALQDLVAAGYLEIRRGGSGGAFVTQLSYPIETWRRRLRNQMSELDELVDFRIAVESRVAYLAAMRSTRTELAEMRAAIRSMRAIARSDPRGRRAFRRSDAEFHEALGRAGRNERLNRTVREARHEMFIPFATFRFDEPIDAVLADHQVIYEAVRDGNRELAAELMSTHIRRTREQLRAFVIGDESIP